jgi:PRTRC genetic system protein C
MPIEIKPLKRTFTFNAVKLPDPGSSFTPEEVKDLYSAQYPDLTTATISEPETNGDTIAYKFVRNVGTKGIGLTAAQLKVIFKDRHGSRAVESATSMHLNFARSIRRPAPIRVKPLPIHPNAMVPYF